jgi:hypothetical protein
LKDKLGSNHNKAEINKVIELHIKNTLEPHNFVLKEEKDEDILALVNEEL